MPAAGPSYPAGPNRFIDREFLVITCETDPELIRAGLPEPLGPTEQAIVHYEWIGAHHFLAGLTLPFGRVVHDYKEVADLAAPTGLAAE